MTPQQMREQDEKDIKHLELISVLLGGVRKTVQATFDHEFGPEWQERARRDQAVLDRIDAYEDDNADETKEDL